MLESEMDSSESSLPNQVGIASIGKTFYICGGGSDLGPTRN